ncbi:MAG TPA: type II toxin-antitoxin system VapB family antitoxin [Solirubrobacteraceae bacterium]|jgi:Arc/MetJ family transcription regulator|nr:type II toxin-antitoxin system VapB family antitoxin [Solirubrobacteraceae bacterium]
MARTNIEIDDRLLGRVMTRYGLNTKRAAVELALRRLDMEPMSADEALEMRGSGWEGDLGELRSGWLARPS